MNSVTLARNTARALLRSEAIILDTETTGLGDDAEICEIAIIRAEDGAVLLNSLVRPSIPNGAEHINGITAEMLATAPTWAEIVVRVWAQVENKPILAYGADFDARMLLQTTLRALLPPEQEPAFIYLFHWRCVMRMFMNWSGTSRRISLRDAAWRCDIQPGTHRALSDCIATRGVLLAMAGMEGGNDGDE